MRPFILGLLLLLVGTVNAQDVNSLPPPVPAIATPVASAVVQPVPAPIVAPPPVYYAPVPQQPRYYYPTQPPQRQGTVTNAAPFQYNHLHVPPGMRMHYRRGLFFTHVDFY